jgi:hypothetical protein
VYYEAIHSNNEWIASLQQALFAMTQEHFVDDSSAFMVLSVREKPAAGWFTVLKGEAYQRYRFSS